MRYVLLFHEWKIYYALMYCKVEPTPTYNSSNSNEHDVKKSEQIYFYFFYRMFMFHASIFHWFELQTAISTALVLYSSEKKIEIIVIKVRVTVTITALSVHNHNQNQWSDTCSHRIWIKNQCTFLLLLRILAGLAVGIEQSFNCYNSAYATTTCITFFPFNSRTQNTDLKVKFIR